MPSAGDHIKVGYRSSVRMGTVMKASILDCVRPADVIMSVVQDYTRLQISVETQGALVDSAGLARGGVTIELMSGPRDTAR